MITFVLFPLPRGLIVDLLCRVGLLLAATYREENSAQELLRELRI
jgi:hypothetical protein